MDDSSITLESTNDINLTANGDLNVQAVNIKLTASSSFSPRGAGGFNDWTPVVEVPLFPHQPSVLKDPVPQLLKGAL